MSIMNCRVAFIRTKLALGGRDRSEFHADHPSWSLDGAGAYYEPKTPFIVCNTRAQIMQIVNSVKANRLQETLADFSKQIDATNHEPACAYGEIGPVVFGASEHVGVVIDNERA